MISRRHLCRSIAAASLGALLAVGTPLLSYATGIAYSAWISAVIAGTTYRMQTSISVPGNGTATGHTQVSADAPKPAGYLGATTWVVDNQSTLVASRTAYSSSALASMLCSVSGSAVSGRSYYTDGAGYAYDPSRGGYGLVGKINSPFQTYALIQGGLEVRDGCTYGTVDNIDVDGNYPDFVAAEATNGKTGYIRTSEYEALLPKKPEEAVSLISAESTKILNVYSFDGSVIGSFVMEFGPAEEVLE